MLLQAHTLSHTQHLQIEELERICGETERLSGSILIEHLDNFNPDIPCFFLLYNEDGVLIAALSLYLPYEEEAEIRAYTHPDYRRRHCFFRLFKAACRVLKAWDIPNITFPFDSRSKSGQSTIHSLNANYLYSEYLMERGSNTAPPVRPICSNAVLSIADKNQLETLIQIHSEAFQEQYAISKELLTSVFEDPNASLYAYHADESLLGLCCTTPFAGKIMVFALAIAVPYQNKRYGYDIMCRLIRLHRVPLCLHVGSYQTAAVHLYHKLDFSIAEQLDYYALRLSDASKIVGAS